MNKAQHFIDLNDVGLPEVEQILQKSEMYKRGTQKVPLFFAQKPLIAGFFLENSTRTKLSFEIAASNLGARFLHFDGDSSSIQKGESLLDSFRCLEAMGVKACVVRWKEEGLLKELSSKLNMSLICAGEGKSSHPSQAMLDYFTLKSYWSEYKGKKLLIAGDLMHSRVFASHKQMAEKMGVELLLSGPKEWIPEECRKDWLEFDGALELADAVMMLRVQNERHDKNTKIENYNSLYGLNETRLKNMKANIPILHPGPFNLGVEIESETLEDSRCKIFEQVQNSVFVRMAIIDHLLGEKNEG